MIELAAAGSKALLKEVKTHQRRMNSVAVRALNKTSKESLGIASKKVRETSLIKDSAIKKKKYLYQRKAFSSKGTSAVQATYKKIPAIHFSVRKTEKGISLGYTKGKKRILIKGAFVTHVYAGRGDDRGRFHKGVFYRYGKKQLAKKGRYAGTGIKRQRINEAFGPSIQSNFADNLPYLARKSEPLLEKWLDSEMNYEFVVKK